MNNSTDTSTLPQYSNSFLFLGVALLVLGLIAIGSQFLFTIGTVIFFGALMLVAGVTEILHMITTKKKGKMIFNVLSALAYVITGCLILYNPLVGALGFTLVMAVFFVVAGALRISYALFHRQLPHWGLFLLGGIINLILGLMIWTGLPGTGFWMIGLFVGIEMIFHGTGWIVLALALKRQKA